MSDFCLTVFKILDPCAYRHKCPACYKQYKKKEHLIQHMKVAYHSVHDPRCGVCKKHCKSFESLREHLTGEMLLQVYFK